MGYKQVIVAEHKTPQHDPDKLAAQRLQAIATHYGHCFRVCGYCGWYNHKDYVCSCGVDTGYLEDENGATVRPLVEVYEVPLREKKHAG